eukprot:8110686-Lingulodinium_polyedra.AAC.1
MSPTGDWRVANDVPWGNVSLNVLKTLRALHRHCAHLGATPVALKNRIHASLFPCLLFTVHCSLATVHCSLFTVHRSLFTVNCSLFTIHCPLFIKYV